MQSIQVCTSAPPEYERNVVAGPGKAEANTVLRFDPQALRDSSIRWFVSQNGIILAADRVSELHIDYVYQRFDAKNMVASSGVTPRLVPPERWNSFCFIALSASL